MTTIATAVVTADDVLSAIWAKLDADATLKDASHLNGSNRIHKTRVPRGIDGGLLNPLNVTLMHNQGLQDKDTGIWTHVVDVEVRGRSNTQIGTPDHATLNNIITRVLNLVLGHGTLSLSGLTFFDVIHESGNGPRRAEDSANEDVVVARLSVGVRVN